MDRPPVYVHRDLSLLHFNERVLQEASDPTVPLFERLVFLGIFSNNLDEFYKSRIASHEFAELKENETKIDKEKNEEARRLRSEINCEMQRLYAEFNRLYGIVWEELNKENVFLINETQLTDEQGVIVRKYFHDTVRQSITPIMLDHLRRTDFLRDKSAYLIAELRSSQDPLKLDYALIEIPTLDLPRFYVLPKNEKGETNIMFLDDVIRYCLRDIFSIFGFDHFAAYSIKFNRNEDVVFDKDRKDYLDDIRKGLRSRSYGDIVRLVYDGQMPLVLLTRLAQIFRIQKKELLKEGGRYHHLKDLSSISRSVVPQEMTYQPMPVVRAAALERGRSILDIVRERDVMLHYPYQSFQNLIDMLLQASVDRQVRSISMTIYRAAKNSRVVNALINAARNEKEVTVYIELQASFDEAANINWAEKMKEEGVRIVYYAPSGLKVHSKLLLIKRIENGKSIYYTAIGTGNPNEATSSIYGDHHLLTADHRLTKDVVQVFKLFESKKLKQPKFNALIVSPFATRNSFIDLLDREIYHANLGREAWAIIKLNNLVDKTIIDKMYEASKAGVKIQCIIRGMCVLIPGVEGLSENITAVRIVDRFLEHARVFVFANNGCPEFFMGSADWMKRNFDNRVEVTTPIFDKEIQSQMLDILEIQLSDNVKARPINGSQLPENATGDERIRSQYAIHELLQRKNT